MQAEGKVLIIGDLIIDRTWPVHVKKISPEAPVPVGNILSNEPIDTPGGASLAAAYAAKHKIPVLFLTATTPQTISWLEQQKIYTFSIQQANNIIKTRYIDEISNYHLVRIDNDDVITPPVISPEDLIEGIKKAQKKSPITAIAALDYRKGIFQQKETCIELVNFCKKNKLPLYVDTRGNPLKFKGCNVLKLNYNEYIKACKTISCSDAQTIISSFSLDYLIITKGHEGAAIYNKENALFTTNPEPNYTGAPDVTGCGDVFDINFCHYWQTQKGLPTEALIFAVNKATEYAYEPMKDRLC